MGLVPYYQDWKSPCDAIIAVEVNYDLGKEYSGAILVAGESLLPVVLDLWPTAPAY